MSEDALTSPAKHNESGRLRGWADETPKQTLSKKVSKSDHHNSKDDILPVAEIAANLVDKSLSKDQSEKNENVSHRAAAFKELNANSTTKLSLEGVNLRLFIQNLVPESQLQEVPLKT